MEDNNAAFQAALEGHLKSKFHEQFINGTRAGFDSAILSMSAQIAQMRTAKEIKAFVKSKADEVRKRLRIGDEVDSNE